jgi:GntR family transcriptional regulator
MVKAVAQYVCTEMKRSPEGGGQVSERPEYLRIAADVRTQISTGAYGPGDKLPTLPELCAAFRVSETTVRNALAVLRSEGLIETRTRAGTIVRDRPPIHRMQADRYRTKPGPPSTAFTRDQGIGWAEYRLDKRFEKVRADAALAALFECEPGEALLARHFVFYDNDQPTQMSTSYVRWSDVAGTPVADPINEPWPGGTRAQLAHIGIRVTRITESFTTGMPSEEEATTLRIGAAVPVLRFTRRHLADDGRVVEVAHPIVRRGDATVVEFDVDLDD